MTSRFAQLPLTWALTSHLNREGAHGLGHGCAGTCLCLHFGEAFGSSALDSRRSCEVRSFLV
eukprot:11453450-Heterocapsa_arctica.AAC.1